MDIWPKIQFIIIDEISMVGCILLTMMHIKLHRLKCNILLFGGIKIMFMGNFFQFPLINDTPLYSTRVQLIFSFTKSTQKKVIGNLWENYIQPNNVIFMEQMRQRKNTQYAKLLKNLRTKNILKLRFEILKTCFPSNLNVNLIDDPMKVITFIIPCNKL
jgi:hypothetical protein